MHTEIVSRATRQKTMLLVSQLEPWSMGDGKGAPSLYETIKGYAAAGWKIHYVTAFKRALDGGSHENNIDIEMTNVTVHRFHFSAPLYKLGSRIQRKADRLFFFHIFAARAVTAILERIDCDLIYAYEEGAVYAVAKARRSRTLGCPIIHRFQGTILGEKYKHLPTLVRKFESWRALRQRADFYIMTDDGTCGDKALRHLNPDCDDANLLFIRNGVDVELLAGRRNQVKLYREFKSDSDPITLLMVSRLAGWKRIDRGIDLLAKLKLRFHNAQLIVVGDGESRGAYERLARERGVYEDISFLGAQPREVVAELMYSCDIFLSLYDISNCGNPLFEAMRSGCPVVTLSNGGTPNVIEDGVNGRLLTPDDHQALERAVTALIVQSELRANLGWGAKKWAENNLLSWSSRMQTEINWLNEKLIAWQPAAF